MGQTVLLAGVNDDVATLEQLMRALVTARVKPYYLHHPDLVRGTGHFRVSIAQRPGADEAALRGRLSGLAQPTYVLDMPGGHGKVPIGPAYLGDDPDALLSRTPSARRTAIRCSPPSSVSLPIGPVAFDRPSRPADVPAFSKVSVTGTLLPLASGAFRP